MRSVTSLSIALMLAGCGGASTDGIAPAANEATRATPTTVATTLSATPPAADCGSTLTGEIDAKEFTVVFGPDSSAFGPKELAATKSTVTERFHAAAARLCASGTIGPMKFAPFKRLMIRNAADATLPNVYADPSLGHDVLVIEYEFDGPSSAPPEAQISAALRCWGLPDSKGCETEGD